MLGGLRGNLAGCQRRSPRGSRSWKVWKLLLSQKFQCFDESRKPQYYYGFNHDQFFHSDAFSRKGDKIHDFYRELMKTEFLDPFNVSTDDAVSLYVQTQMLMCIRGAQLIERNEFVSMFADFGRFESWRVAKLLEQMQEDPDLAKGITSAFDETPSKFFGELGARLKIVGTNMWGGVNYFWASIRDWSPHGPSAAADDS